MNTPPNDEKYDEQGIDWEGLKGFNENLPPPTGRSIFDRIRPGIIARITLGYTVPQIAAEISKAAKLPIKDSHLRTWLARRKISCRSTRQSGQPVSTPQTAPSLQTAATTPNTITPLAEKGFQGVDFELQQALVDQLTKNVQAN